MATPQPPTRRRHVVRRLPPLAQAAVGLALLLAIFPSTLHLPHIGPNAQAEVAPVPGQQQNGDIADLNNGNGNGLGSGGSGVDSSGAATPSAAPGPNGGGGKPGTLACVGNPPRQTEDPLSPPCVHGWAGSNNRGTTAPGVNGNTIKVILYAVSNHGATDYSQPGTGSDSGMRRDIRSPLRFFQTRFETYGRTVQLILQPSVGGSPDADVADAHTTLEQNPFAVLIGDRAAFGADIRPYVSTVAAGHVLVFIDPEDQSKLSRSFLASTAPYVYSFQPDMETNESTLASFVCRELVGSAATHAPDLTLRSSVRNFAIVYDSDSSTYSNSAGPVFGSALHQACGQQPTTATLSGGSDDVAVVERLHAQGVTTIIDLGETYTLLGALAQSSPPFEPEIVMSTDSTYGSANQNDAYEDRKSVV